MLIGLLTILGVNLSAQRQKQVIKWFSIAPKVYIGNSVFLNSDIMGDKNISPDYLTLGYGYGGKFTYSLGQEHHFGLEYMLSSFGQKYSMRASTDDTPYTKTLAMTGVELAPYYRYRGMQGGFVDAGFKFTILKTAEVSNAGVLQTQWQGDVLDKYSPKFTSLLFGVGMSFQLHDRIDLNAGVRFAYSISDITPDDFNVTDDLVYRPSYLAEAETNPLSANLFLELNYYFAFYGDAKCGRGRLMFFQ